MVNATAQPGRCTDDWESVWYVGDAGITGEVKEPLLANWSDPEAFKLPWDLIANGIYPM